jgi:hypothetical protein
MDEDIVAHDGERDKWTSNYPAIPNMLGLDRQIQTALLDLSIQGEQWGRSGIWHAKFGIAVNHPGPLTARQRP